MATGRRFSNVGSSLMVAYRGKDAALGRVLGVKGHVVCCQITGPIL